MCLLTIYYEIFARCHFKSGSFLYATFWVSNRPRMWERTIAVTLNCCQLVANDLKCGQTFRLLYYMKYYRRYNNQRIRQHSSRKERPWLEVVTWREKIWLSKCQITCFHIRTLHFGRKEWVLRTADFLNYVCFKILAKFDFCLLLNY